MSCLCSSIQHACLNVTVNTTVLECIMRRVWPVCDILYIDCRGKETRRAREQFMTCIRPDYEHEAWKHILLQKLPVKQLVNRDTLAMPLQQQDEVTFTLRRCQSSSKRLCMYNSTFGHTPRAWSTTTQWLSLVTYRCRLIFRLQKVVLGNDKYCQRHAALE